MFSSISMRNQQFLPSTFNLQFGFRVKHTTTHALIHLTEKFREQLDSGNYCCRVSADFQNAFDTVDDTILTQKLNFQIKFWKVHHFADDTNPINFNSSIKVINKQLHKDLKTLTN